MKVTQGTAPLMALSQTTQQTHGTATQSTAPFMATQGTAPFVVALPSAPTNVLVLLVTFPGR